MKINLTVQALRDLREQLGISQRTTAQILKVPQTTFSQYESEKHPMPEKVHGEYERLIFDVLNRERVVPRYEDRSAFTPKERQDTDCERRCRKLSECRMIIKEYGALLEMYRKEKI